MKKIIILLVAISTLHGCEEDLLDDNISYTNLGSELKIQSVNSYEAGTLPGCSDVPIPEKSNLSFVIDINNDLVEDFEIQVDHYKTEEGCGCQQFIYSISVSGLSGDAYIIKKENPANLPIAKPIEENDIIGNSDNWVKSCHLQYIISECVLLSHSFDIGYFGLKINNNFGWLKAENLDSNGISIKEYAINLTSGNTINAGQKE